MQGPPLPAFPFATKISAPKQRLSTAPKQSAAVPPAEAHVCRPHRRGLQPGRDFLGPDGFQSAAKASSWRRRRRPRRRTARSPRPSARPAPTSNLRRAGQFGPLFLKPPTSRIARVAPAPWFEAPRKGLPALCGSRGERTNGGVGRGAAGEREGASEGRRSSRPCVGKAGSGLLPCVLKLKIEWRPAGLRSLRASACCQCSASTGIRERRHSRRGGWGRKRPGSAECNRYIHKIILVPLVHICRTYTGVRVPMKNLVGAGPGSWIQESFSSPLAAVVDRPTAKQQGRRCRY